MDKSSNAYKKAYKDANDVYGTKSSIYRSAYIVKKYKEYGGKYDKKSKKPSSKTPGLKRWFKSEIWIEVLPFLQKNEIVICGSSKDRVGKACRPVFRASSKTPITLPELLEIHTEKDIIKAAKIKEKYPEKRLTWKTLNLS